MKKNIYNIVSLFIITIISLPAFATQWIEYGDNTWIDKASYDKITANSERLDIVTKTKNPNNLAFDKILSKSSSSPSVCLERNIYDCKNNKVFLQSILCYDRNGKIVGDKVWEDSPKFWLKDESGINCKLIKSYKVTHKMGLY